MNWKQIIHSAAVCLLPFSHAAAQEKSVTVEATFARAEENHTIRLSGLYNGALSLSGFADGFGPKTDRYYGELYARKDFAKRFGSQFEINQGNQAGPNVPFTLRAGAIFDLVASKNFYASLKVLPITVTRGGLQQSYQIGTFVQANLPRGIYAENWADYNFGREKPATFTEFTFGKRIIGKWSAECQLPYNTNSPGWIVRCGGRYNIF